MSPGRSPGRLFEVCAQSSRIGVESWVSWPCGPDSPPRPEYHRRRVLRHEAGGVGYWFCPRGRRLALQALPHRPGGLVPIHARGFSPSSLRAVPREGWEGVDTRTQRDRAVRRRGELARDHGSRRVSAAIDAQRRLNARPPRGTRTKADAAGPSSSRYAYLTRTYD
jgi:hypothetical protein